MISDRHWKDLRERLQGAISGTKTALGSARHEKTRLLGKASSEKNDRVKRDLKGRVGMLTSEINELERRKEKLEDFREQAGDHKKRTDSLYQNIKKSLS